jgi:hypothetical protein
MKFPAIVSGLLVGLLAGSFLYYRSGQFSNNAPPLAGWQLLGML